MPHGAEALRALAQKLGDDVELLHDVHERVPPHPGDQSGKALEQFRLFFLEDPFRRRTSATSGCCAQQTSTPIAMGELFNTQTSICR